MAISHQMSYSFVPEDNLMNKLMRWLLFGVAFVLTAVVFNLSKELFPPGFFAGFVRSALAIVFLRIVWRWANSGDDVLSQPESE